MAWPQFHDLRHSAASAMINVSVDLYTAGAVLGRKLPASTQRHAHLVTESLRSVTDRTSQKIPTKRKCGPHEKSCSPHQSWWAPPESNWAPTDYESAALTKHELGAQFLRALQCRARGLCAYPLDRTAAS